MILQGHLDMVGDKAAGCDIDMEREGPRVYVDGDFLRADGTTLGADNGIAVAYMLALLDAKDNSIPHPRLEVVLTVCEEVGLLGASAMDFYPCRARRMINIESVSSERDFSANWNWWGYWAVIPGWRSIREEPTAPCC